MQCLSGLSCQAVLVGGFCALGLSWSFSGAGAFAQDARVLSFENIAQASQGGAGWQPAVKDLSLAVGDRFRTRQRSRVLLQPQLGAARPAGLGGGPVAGVLLGLDELARARLGDEGLEPAHHGTRAISLRTRETR